VHAGRQVELHQSVNSLVCRIDDVHQSLMSSDFKLIAAGLVDVRAAKNIEALDACGQRDRTSDNSTGSLAGINNFKSRLIDQFVIKFVVVNTNTLALHYLSFKERGAEAFFGPRFEMS